MNFTAKQREAILKGIYTGEITPRNLPIEVYEGTKKHLTGALNKGFGKKSGFIYESLDDNLNLFSSAKTFQQTLDMSLMYEEGMSEDEFIEAAGQRFDLYNETYLNAEINSTILQSQNAREWQDIEDKKEELPLLRYSAVIDENTAEVCRQCDGVTLPVDDPFWNTYSPENHYNCRCLLEQLDEDNSTVDPPEDIETPDPVFDNNVGKTGEIFNKHHPYFDVPKEYKEFAKRNFGLPVE